MAISATILVVNLKTPSRWVDSFVVEVYSDSGLATKVGQKSAVAQWDPDQDLTVQKSAITLDGLIFGSTYYLRAGVVAPVSGLITWSDQYAQIAGYEPGGGPVGDPAGLTFTAQITPSETGASFHVTVHNPPPNINFFQMYWTTGNDAPVDSSWAQWQGQANPNSDGGVFDVFVPGQDGDVITAWARGILTNGTGTNWQELGQAHVGAQAGSDNCCDCINPLDFGAVGDGASDDTAAVQAALDLAATNANGTVGDSGSSLIMASGGDGGGQLSVITPTGSSTSRSTTVCIPSGYTFLVSPQANPPNGMDTSTQFGAVFGFENFSPCLYIDSNVGLKVQGTLKLSAVDTSVSTRASTAIIMNRNACNGGPMASNAAEAQPLVPGTFASNVTGPFDENIHIWGEGWFDSGSNNTVDNDAQAPAIVLQKCNKSSVREVNFNCNRGTAVYFGYSFDAAVYEINIVHNSGMCHGGGSIAFNGIQSGAINDCRSRDGQMPMVGLFMSQNVTVDGNVAENQCYLAYVRSAGIEYFELWTTDFIANITISNNTLFHARSGISVDHGSICDGAGIDVMGDHTDDAGVRYRIRNVAVSNNIIYDVPAFGIRFARVGGGNVIANSMNKVGAGGAFSGLGGILGDALDDVNVVFNTLDDYIPGIFPAMIDAGLYEPTTVYGPTTFTNNSYVFNPTLERSDHRAVSQFKSTAVDYTVLVSDSIINVDATAANRVVMLPDPVVGQEYEFVVKKIDSSAHTVTIRSFNGTSLIDGATTLVLTTQWQSARVRSDGTSYFKI